MGRTRLRGLEIAGIQIGVEVSDLCEWDWPESDLRDFSCLPREPEVHVGLRIAEPASVELAGERYALGASTFEIARRGEDWLIALTRGGRRRQLALFSSDFRVGEIVQSPEWAERRGYPLAGGLDEWLVLQRTVARGGLCLAGQVEASAGGAEVLLGAQPRATRAWSVAAPSLLGRATLVVRREAGALRIHRTPWNGGLAEAFGRAPRITGFAVCDPTESVAREVLDPTDAAEELVRQAVLPTCDERFFERVLANARQIAEDSRLVRYGRSEAPSLAPARSAGWVMAPVHGPVRNAL